MLFFLCLLRRLGQPGSSGAVTGHRALRLLLEGNVKEPPCLMEPLVVLRIRRVGDVSEATGGGYHVVGRVGEAQRAGHPRAVVVVAKSGLLLLHLLPRPLELGFGGVEIHLPGLEARILLLEVGRVAGGAQIRRCEVRSINGGSPVVDEEALAGGREVVDVVGVVLQAIPRENLKEVAQRGDIGPHRAREDDATRRLSADEVLQLELERLRRILDPV